MSFSTQKLTVFFAVLMGLFFSSVAAYADFPDLGVVGEHRLMTVVGFAQQDFYFDLFQNGGLQTLALTFALIGGLLILLIPKNHNFITIGCYLFLVFLLVLGPTPSEDSLFFYDLGANEEAWNCPVPPNGDGLKMEVFCKEGIESYAGNIKDSLSEYTNDEANTFGAFTPQLVAIHFFTAVERTLINALWGDTRNHTVPADMIGNIDSSPLAARVVQNNENIKYHEAVYSSLCGAKGHDGLQSTPDLMKLPDHVLKAAAEETFTFEDALIANRIYYNGFSENAVYPVRAATARLHKNDYAKSLQFDDAEKHLRARSIIDSLDITSSIRRLENYKGIRQQQSDSTLDFPHSNNSNRTHVFRSLLMNDDDYNYGMTGAWEYLREPDPYDYELNDDRQLVTHGGDVVNGSQSVSSIRGGDGAAVAWRYDISLPSGLKKPILEDEFNQALKPYFRALMDSNNNNFNLAMNMRDYPVQLFVPYVGIPSGGTESFPMVGGHGTSLIGGLLPRTYGTDENLGGVNTGLAGNNDMTAAVQSCLDFAALIWSRKIYAMEEAGILPDGVDFRRNLTIGELKSLVADADGTRADGTSSPEQQDLESNLAESARVSLLRQGVVQDSAGGWVGDVADGSVSLDNAGTFTKDVCGWMGEDGYMCKGALWGNGFFNKAKATVDKAQTGNFSSITLSPEGGAIGYGGLNAYTAGFGNFLVEYGLMIASAVQGFVFGAYMKLMPVIISYGLALALFMTPFAFLMGIAVPMQAKSVLIAPVVAVAFLKTVSIALVLIDHAFVSLMFWVESVNFADEGLYKSMLIMAHLTASVSVFSLAGLLLFGLNDAGSFVKHLSTLDKAGQVSFQEAMAYGAAPMAIAGKGVGLAKKGVGMTSSAVIGTIGYGAEKVGKSQARAMLKDGRLSEEQIAGRLDTAAAVAHSTGWQGFKDTVTGKKRAAAGMLGEQERIEKTDKTRDSLGDTFTQQGRTISAMKKADDAHSAGLKASTEGQLKAAQDRELAEIKQQATIAQNAANLSPEGREVSALAGAQAQANVEDSLVKAKAAVAQAPMKKLRMQQAQFDNVKGDLVSLTRGIANANNNLKADKGAPNVSKGSHQLADPVSEAMTQFVNFANRNAEFELDINQVSQQVVDAFQSITKDMSPDQQKAIFKKGASANERHGFVAADANFMQKMASKAFAGNEAAIAQFNENMGKKQKGDYIVMDNTEGSKGEVTKLLKKEGILS